MEAAEGIFQACYTEPKMPKLANGQPDKLTIQKEILNPKGIPVTAGGREINYDVLYRHHVVVYGESHGNSTTQTFCGSKITMYRYLGYTESGQEILNPFFRVDIEARPKYFKTNKFYANPWETSSPVYKKAQGYPNFPKPVQKTISTEDLNRAWDSFDGTDANPQGYLVTNNDHTGKNMLGDNLRPYASIDILPGKFSFGTFTVYSQGDCILNVCYSTHLIPPKEDPFVSQNDALVDLTVKSTFKNEKITGTVSIQNKWGEDRLSITSPCDNTKKAGFAQCKTTNRGGGIVVTYKGKDGKANEEVFRKVLDFAEIKKGNKKDLALADFNIPFEKGGQYEIHIWIPHYVDLKGIDESNYGNNEVTKTITVEMDQNAFVTISGSSSYSMSDILTNTITMTNDTNVPLSGDVQVQILDQNGTVYKTLNSKSYQNIAAKNNFSFNLQEYNILLPMGSYTIKANIPHYTNLPESDYDDNEATLQIHIRPFVPENTKCKKITTEYVNILPYGDEEPGITRACIGWAPNFPSTRVEGGQGTYFYFAYKIFPTPMPAYEVTTTDDLGLYQTFQLSEPTTKLGACDFRKDDTECKMYEPFLYYPAKWESRFGSDPALSDFVGPYTVGPHEFYHYRYRGRLLPKQITFHYDIVDMENNKSNIPLAFGEIVYDLPDECFYQDIIDIKEECRTIQFYVPTDGRANPLKLPDDAQAKEIPKERIRFYNPGEHTFRVEVDEKQIYLYQSDEGKEWQGKENVYREKWVTDKDEVPVVEKKYVEIHRYDEGKFQADSYDPSTRTGVGGWCFGYLTCSLRPEGVYMSKVYTYNRDGFKGTLTEVTEKKQHVLNEGNPSDYRHYASRWMTGPDDKDACYTATPAIGPEKGITQEYCDVNGVGYDYFQRGIFKKKDGTVYYSGWRSHHSSRLFPGWEGNLNTLHPDFYGYEWKRYQILGGWVTKTTGGTESSGSSSTSEYRIGPVVTHTVETLPHGEKVWKNQDEYKNHCYSEEDAFSDYGEWNKTTSKFTEKDSPALVCFHNHGDDFHYWEFDWTPVKMFGGDTYKGFIY